MGKIRISDSKCPKSYKTISESSAVWNFKSPVTRQSALKDFESFINSEPLPAQNATRFSFFIFLLFTKREFGQIFFIFFEKSSIEIPCSKSTNRKNSCP